jgi:hypothetical protein
MKAFSRLFPKWHWKDLSHLPIKWPRNLPGLESDTGTFGNFWSCLSGSKHLRCLTKSFRENRLLSLKKESCKFVKYLYSNNSQILRELRCKCHYPIVQKFQRFSHLFELVNRITTLLNDSDIKTLIPYHYNTFLKIYSNKIWIVEKSSAILLSIHMVWMLCAL